jgi:predicted 2-oxoglutarate/Fe(II)-dependent dioxygenase YbiX
MMQQNELHYEFDLIDDIEIYIMEYTEPSAGYVDWHCDFSGQELYDQSKGKQIKLSLSLMLTDTFTGGELEFDEGMQQLGKGEYIIFPSLWRHRVNPVVSGTRVSLVAWQYGPNWK